MKRISVAGLVLFFLFFTASSLFAQQGSTTAGQIFDNSRPATGQGNEISTGRVPNTLPAPPPTVQGAPVRPSTGTAGGYNVNTSSGAAQVRPSTGTAGGYNVNTSSGTKVQGNTMQMRGGSDIQRMKSNPPPPPVKSSPPPAPAKSPPPKK